MPLLSPATNVPNVSTPDVWVWELPAPEYRPPAPLERNFPWRIEMADHGHQPQGINATPDGAAAESFLWRPVPPNGWHTKILEEFDTDDLDLSDGQSHGKWSCQRHQTHEARSNPPCTPVVVTGIRNEEAVFGFDGGSHYAFWAVWDRAGTSMDTIDDAVFEVSAVYRTILKGPGYTPAVQHRVEASEGFGLVLYKQRGVQSGLLVNVTREGIATLSSFGAYSDSPPHVRRPFAAKDLGTTYANVMSCRDGSSNRWKLRVEVKGGRHISVTLWPSSANVPPSPQLRHSLSDTERSESRLDRYAGFFAQLTSGEFEPATRDSRFAFDYFHWYSTRP